MWWPRTTWKLGRSTGRLSNSSRQKVSTAAMTSWVSVSSSWMLGTRTFQRPDGPGASTWIALRTAFHRWTMSWAWQRQKSLMARLPWAARSVRRWRMSSSRAAACPSKSSCSWPCVAGWNPTNAPLSASVSRSAALEWTPWQAAFAWYAAGANAARALYRRIAAWSRFPLSGGSPPIRFDPAGDSCRRPTRGARALCGA